MLSSIELELLHAEKNDKHSIYDKVADIFWPVPTATGAISIITFALYSPYKFRERG